MKKTVLMSMAAVSALTASSIDEAFVAGKTSGQIRTAYTSMEYDAGGNDNATTLGGILKYETADWNGLKLGAAAYVSQKIHGATGNQEDNHLNTEHLLS